MNLNMVLFNVCLQMSVYKSVISYFKAHASSPPSSPSSGSSDSTPPLSPSRRWRQKLSRLLESHPHLAGESSSEEEGEGPTGGVATPEDVDFSLSSSESEEEEEEGEGDEGGGVVIPAKSRRDVMVLKRAKVSLHMCAITKWSLR